MTQKTCRDVNLMTDLCEMGNSIFIVWMQCHVWKSHRLENSSYNKTRWMLIFYYAALKPNGVWESANRFSSEPTPQQPMVSTCIMLFYADALSHCTFARPWHLKVKLLSRQWSYIDTAFVTISKRVLWTFMIDSKISTYLVKKFK